MLILGIETSCDDTAAAVLSVQAGPEPAEQGADTPIKVTVLADLIQSQAATHSPYGGVVPELASRRHLENIEPVVRTTLSQAGIGSKEVDLIAVTQGPGLVGSLLVGFNFAKALSLAAAVPYVGIDHIAGHLASVFLGRQTPRFPYLALTASGGHSSIFLVESPTRFTLCGRTRDDAAGEAFDKVAKLLGLGYPGGPEVSRLAAAGNPAAWDFPRAWLEPDSCDFSFSGLKTAVAQQIRRTPPAHEGELADICASFQEAVVEVLTQKTLAAAHRLGIEQVVLSGGVAANPRLRQYLQGVAERDGRLKIFMPEPRFCTDNAAMIAMAGYFQRHQATRTLDSDVYSRSGYLLPPESASGRHSHGPIAQG